MRRSDRAQFDGLKPAGSRALPRHGLGLRGRTKSCFSDGVIFLKKGVAMKATISGLIHCLLQARLARAWNRWSCPVAQSRWDVSKSFDLFRPLCWARRMVGNSLRSNWVLI